MIARFFDGKRGCATNVSVEIKNTTMLVKSKNYNSHDEWSFLDIKVVAFPENGRDAILTLKSNPESRLIISNEIFKKLSELLPRSSKPLHISVSLKVILFFSLLATIIYFVIYNSIPLLSKKLSHKVPLSWSRSLGLWSSKAIHGNDKLCNNESGIKALRKISDKLQDKANIDHEIHLYVLKHNKMNAFTTPSGYITIFSKTIEYATSEDEIAGILAHELAHVKMKHPTESFIRSVSSYILLNIIFGNSGADNIALLANSFNELKYSRENEREADKLALIILQESGFKSDGLMNFFLRIKKQNYNNKSLNEGLSYFSTHPMIEERIELIKNNSFPSQDKKHLSNQEWRALKNICNDIP